MTTDVQFVDCKTTTIDTVTVFSNRAEIRRNIALTLKQGISEINISNVPGELIQDSVRISGTGTASIHEVQVGWKSASPRDQDCPQAKELRAQLELLEKKSTVLTNERNILEKKREALDSFIMNIWKEKGTGISQSSNESLQQIDNLYDYYGERATVFQEKKDSLDKELSNIQENINKVRNDLNRYTHSDFVHTVTVVLETSDAAEIVLVLSYQVDNAAWRPSYDIRVDTGDENHLNLTYSGHITQNSGEEWANCKLILSTARPSIGGNIPELGTLDVSLYVKPDQAAFQGGYGASEMYETRCYAAAPMMMCAKLDSQPLPSVINITAGVSEQAVSTEFHIQRPAAIPPDGSEHKVTIGAASFVPIMQYECVPSKSNNAYITATAKNFSDLPFLPGEAAVFLNGNFITKSHLKAVSPGEFFTVSLGVDAAVKLDFKPAHTKQGETGTVTKVATTLHEQKFTIKNTRKEDIQITLKDSIPRSTDEKITISVLNPDGVETVEAEEGVARQLGAILNATTHNLEWTIKVPQGDKQDLVVKWQAQYPSGEKLEFNEKF